MPKFIVPPPNDTVAILTDLLNRAQAGDLHIRHYGQRSQMGQDSEIEIVLIDVSSTSSPAAVRISGMAQVLAQQLLTHTPITPPYTFDFPVGKPIEELGVTTEPIVGYRDFLLDGSLDEVCLLSRNQTEWPKFKPLIATCVTEDDNVAKALRSHDAPEISCSCGIYSFDTPKHEDMDFACDVWGEIYGWGETYICDSGYRTEFAYPKSIFIRSYGTKTADRIADAIREQYGVPVYIVATRDGLTEGDVLEQMIHGDKDYYVKLDCKCPAGSYDPGNVHEPYCPLYEGGDTNISDSTT